MLTGPAGYGFAEDPFGFHTGAAVEEGRLSADRMDSYAKLRRELETLEARRGCMAFDIAL